jgi:hypothetical protein
MKPSAMRMTLAALPASLVLMAGASAFAQDPSHPDLGGIWKMTAPVPAARTEDGKAPPLLPAARAVYAKHLAMGKKGDFSFQGLADCLPPGLPHIDMVDKPIEILQKPKTLYFLYQENRIPRRVYLDQSHGDVDPDWFGDSTGEWEGDTLVVDTIGLNDISMLDHSGLPHSENLHVTERYRLRQGGVLENRITIDDPKDYAAPWTTVVRYRRMPAGYKIAEEVCTAHFLQTETLAGAKPNARTAKK